MASKAKNPNVPAVPLNEILSPLREALWRTCGRRDLGMNEIGQASPSRPLFALTGPGTIPAKTDRKCMLNCLFPKTHPELWLGILLELKKRSPESPRAKENYEVVHVSIQAFEGATSQILEPLLRAEWDQIGARSKSGPAQPHWHAYAMSIEMRGGLGDEDYQNFDGGPAAGVNSKARQHHVHFALCANWHKQNGSRFEVLDTPEELKNWIVGVLEYIKSEA
jgi:hypothetical protein